MDDFISRGAEEAAKVSRFSVGLGMLGCAATLSICWRVGCDHLIGVLAGGGAFHVFASLGRKLDGWWS
ncbi:MAG: hypothetical protein ABTD50_23640 [Polyangiaceae bacterium]|jgi:hypothetical protein